MPSYSTTVNPWAFAPSREVISGPDADGRSHLAPYAPAVAGKEAQSKSASVGTAEFTYFSTTAAR